MPSGYSHPSLLRIERSEEISRDSIANFKAPTFRTDYQWGAEDK
jgi:hypothetical protein